MDKYLCMQLAKLGTHAYTASHYAAHEARLCRTCRYITVYIYIYIYICGMPNLATSDSSNTHECFGLAFGRSK